MKKQFCFFGTAFLMPRIQRQITQWQVAISTGYHVTNLSKIEQELSQPGIGLVMQLVMALDVSVGDFFQALLEEFAVTESDDLTQSKTSIPVHFTPFLGEGVRCPLVYIRHK